MSNSHIHFRLPLTKDEFAQALRKGQGRAMLHVHEYGLECVADLVFDACLHNQVYDRLFEGNHADWLFQMIEGAERYQQYRQSILAALSSGVEARDQIQLCRFAEIMVERGDEEAKEHVRDFVYRTVQTIQEDDSLDSYAAVTWVELEGENGLLEIARFYGQRLIANPNDLVDPENLKRLANHGIEIDYQGILQKAATSDVAIRKYWDYVLERQKPEVHYPLPNNVLREKARERKKKFRQEYPLEKILESAHNKVDKKLWEYRNFGRYATRKELEQVYLHLLNEIDEDVRTRLLWVFCAVAIPALPQKIFEWANGEHEDLRSAAINVLAQLRDDRIYEFAVSKILRGEVLGPDDDVLDLFQKNYDDRVPKLISQVLSTIKPSDDDSHNLGMGIVGLFGKHEDVNLADCLKWVYANTPCSFCRSSSVRDLLEANAVDNEILNECQYDSFDETRELALKYLEVNALSEE